MHPAAEFQAVVLHVCHSFLLAGEQCALLQVLLREGRAMALADQVGLAAEDGNIHSHS